MARAAARQWRNSAILADQAELVAERHLVDLEAAAGAGRNAKTFARPRQQHTASEAPIDPARDLPRIYPGQTMPRGELEALEPEADLGRFWREPLENR